MQNEPKCLFCGRTSQEVPLVNITYKTQLTWICSEHLPVLIHEPQKLAAQLQKAVEEK